MVDAGSGRLLANYTFTTTEPTFINDVVLTPWGHYFTDSMEAALYHLPLGPGGRLPAQSRVRRIPLARGLGAGAGFQRERHCAYARRRRAARRAVRHRACCCRVDPSSGVAEQVDLGGYLLSNGDGLLLERDTLYAVLNQLNTVAVLRMSADGRSGRLVAELTDPRFDVPTTVAAYRGRLYLPNARFTTPPTPETPYTAVAIPKP